MFWDCCPFISVDFSHGKKVHDVVQMSLEACSSKFSGDLDVS